LVVIGDYQLSCTQNYIMIVQYIYFYKNI